MLKVSKDLFDLFYPIGTYYETSNADWTPQNAGWYGTWVEDTDGRVTVSKSTDIEFNTLLKTGGSKYLQQHTHGFYGALTGETTPITNYGNDWAPTTTAWQKDNAVAGVNNVTTGDSGNLQPYIVVRRWHRTA